MTQNNPYVQHNHSIQNPVTPYTGEIPGGLVSGKLVQISGIFTSHPDRFDINFKSKDGIGLHMSCRFKEKAVIRNSSIRNLWGIEERSGSFPFKKGQPFEIAVLAEGDRFRVSLNGVHAFDYLFRSTLNEINQLSYIGDVSIFRISYSLNIRAHECLNPQVPFMSPLVYGVSPGRLFQIQGIVANNCGRFQIDFQKGVGHQPDNIGFSFSVRFNDPSTSQPVVVRQNRTNGVWGMEERSQPYFPFQLGCNFDILILVDNNEYKVAVNGSHFISYQHRNKLLDVNYIAVYGDIAVNFLRYY